MISPKHSVAGDVSVKFGGHAELANALKLSLSTVYRWTYPPGVKRGTDGLIPVKHHERILKAAMKRGLEITQADLYPKE